MTNNTLNTIHELQKHEERIRNLIALKKTRLLRSLGWEPDRDTLDWTFWTKRSPNTGFVIALKTADECLEIEKVWAGAHEADLRRAM